MLPPRTVLTAIDFSPGSRAAMRFASRLARHIMFSGGHRFRLANKASFTTSGLLKFAPGAPPAFDLNAMVEWKRVFGIGAGYSNGDAFTAMM